MKAFVDHKNFLFYLASLWIPMAITVAALVTFDSLAIRANPIPI
jgi:hypothetical protein